MHFLTCIYPGFHCLLLLLQLLTMSREAFERLLGPSEQIFRPALAEYQRFNSQRVAQGAPGS